MKCTAEECRLSKVAARAARGVGGVGRPGFAKKLVCAVLKQTDQLGQKPLIGSNMSCYPARCRKSKRLKNHKHGTGYCFFVQGINFSNIILGVPIFRDA